MKKTSLLFVAVVSMVLVSVSWAQISVNEIGTVIEDTTFIGDDNGSALLVKANNVIIQNCTFENFSKAVVVGYGGLGATVVNVQIKNCTFNNNRWYAIELLNVGGSLIDSCEINGNPIVGGILAYQTSGTTISNNLISGYSGSTGIVVANSSHNYITQNILSNNWDGIQLNSDSDNNTINSNQTNNNVQDGIEIYAGHYNTVSNNSGNNNGRYGINVVAGGVSGSSNNHGVGNNVKGNEANSIGTTDNGNNIENNPDVVESGVLYEQNTAFTFTLSQNYPNPFNPTTNISYEIVQSGNVNLTIYNTTGQVVTVLVNEHQTPGVHTTNWTASDQPAGVYFSKLQAGNNTQICKMILTK